MSNKDTEMARSGFGEFTGRIYGKKFFTRKQAELAIRKCEIYRFIRMLDLGWTQRERPSSMAAGKVCGLSSVR